MGQLVLPQIAAEHLQPAVRGQLLAHELDVQLSLDHPSQARYAQTHQAGLLCVGSDVGTSSPLNNAQEAALFQRIPSLLTAQLFSDQGYDAGWSLANCVTDSAQPPELADQWRRKPEPQQAAGEAAAAEPTAPYTAVPLAQN